MRCRRFMSGMRVVIFGASGFVGKHLALALRTRGDDVRTASMRDAQAAADAARGCDAVVNLAGEPVAQRWNDETKRHILESRTLAPAAFLERLKASDNLPHAYISASAVGYYGTSLTETFTEESAPGSGFLAEVCVQWERVAQSARQLGIRVACVRTGVALGSDGGALEKILPIFKTGAGGKIASGKQWFSWIHIDDLVGMYVFALDQIQGSLNATAPNPVRNEDFTHALAAALHRPAFFPVPSFALKAMLGEGADTLTEGQRVLPARATAAGFAFRFPTVESALAQIVG